MKMNLFMLFSAISLSISAQDIAISAGAEKTVAGNQYGGQLMYETKMYWGAGVFCQASIHKGNGENFLKDLFYGISMQAPIAKSERISFVGLIRSGFVNEKYFVVVPSVETRIKVTSKAGAAIGAGLRSGYPSLSVKLFVRIL